MSIFLETKRLILKPIASTDLDNLFALRSDPVVMKYIGDGSVQTKEQVENFIQCGSGYFEKYGLDFFSVFEKETGDFVGQAGLFHVGFDVNQPDIELAYRLHTKYWNRGYATECAKALIDYGFNQLSLSKIIAAVRPKNERSRRVMEKAGMSYTGIVDFRGSLWPCYVIYNNSIDVTKIQLIPATLKDYPIIQNMGRFYVYDMSEYMHWEIPADGLFECIDFKKYWQIDNTLPFLIRYKNELAGFVIIDKKGSDATIDFNVAQFFILKKFKNQGMGRHVAHQVFDQFIGAWEVMVIPGNEGAYRFWRSVIKNYTDNNFLEYTKEIAHFDNNAKNIFKFDSRNNTAAKSHLK